MLLPLGLAISCGSADEETRESALASIVEPDCGTPPGDAGPPPSDAGSGSPGCIELVNPHGQTIPPAGSTTLPGPRGGQNEDGFYRISSTTGADVVVVDQGSGTVFGPYPSGTVIKYTQAPGGTPEEKKIGSTNGQAGAVYVHLTGTGDAGVRLATGGALVMCLVPPKPK
jgi:hypothetical protein